MPNPLIQAATLTLTGQYTDSNLPGVVNGPVELLIRANGAGVFLIAAGNDESVPANGFELLAGKEYRFQLYPVPLAGSSDQNQPFVVNGVGGTVTVSYVVTPLH